MRNSFVVFLIISLGFISCDSEPLAQDMPSLQGTRWEYSESETWEEASNSTLKTLYFRDDERVVYRYEYEGYDMFNTYSGSEELVYVYRYDFSVKQGVFIYEDGGTASFELRGNLLFLTMGYDTYIFRRI